MHKHLDVFSIIYTYQHSYYSQTPSTTLPVAKSVFHLIYISTSMLSLFFPTTSFSLFPAPPFPCLLFHFLYFPFPCSLIVSFSFIHIHSSPIFLSPSASLYFSYLCSYTPAVSPVFALLILFIIHTYLLPPRPQQPTT